MNGQGQQQGGQAQYNPPAASQLSAASAAAIQKAGGMASGRRGYLYSSATFKQGASTGSTEIVLFNKALDDNMQEIGGTTNFKATLQHTNMSDSGKLPLDVVFRYNRIFVHVVATANQATFNSATDTDGTPSTTDGANAAFCAPATIIRSIQENCVLRFSVQNQLLYAGPVFQYPSEFGISGHAAALGSGLTDGAANNGFGRAIPLDENWLDSGRPFKATLQFPAAAQTMPTANWIRIYVYLGGKVWGPLIG
jgi:hypothetical protein